MERVRYFRLAREMGKDGLPQVKASLGLSLIFSRDVAPAGFPGQDMGGLFLPVV